MCPWNYPRDLQKKKHYQPSQKNFLLFFFKDFWISIVKIMCPRVGQGFNTNLQKQKPIVNKRYSCLVKLGRTIFNS